MFSKAPKRKGSSTGTNVSKRLTVAQIAQARSASKKYSYGISAKRKHIIADGFLMSSKSMQAQPVIFVTIDRNLENIELNSTMTAKAEAAKKMFSLIKH